jgi:hypothetical protein
MLIGGADALDDVRRGVDRLRVLVDYLNTLVAAGRLRRMDPFWQAQL